MITVNITRGNQVHGLRLDDELDDLIFGNLTDAQSVERVTQFLKDYTALIVAFDQGQSLASAHQYVEQHTEEVR